MTIVIGKQIQSRQRLQRLLVQLLDHPPKKNQRPKRWLTTTTSSTTNTTTTTKSAPVVNRIYAVGEGWTGAFGTGRLDQTIAGHNDEDDEVSQSVVPLEIFSTSSSRNNNKNEQIQSCSLGWGHTAIIVGDKLFITGRPHDFSALLRLKRLPKSVRDYSVHQTLQTTEDVSYTTSLHPVALIGRLVTWLSEVLAPDEHNDWELARLQSSMAQFTPIDAFPNHPHMNDSTNNQQQQEQDSDSNTSDDKKATSSLSSSLLFNGEVPVNVVCSAGITAVTTSVGNLYMFGLNGLGQCGIGYTSNNVWKPQPVTGLSSEFANTPRSELPQSHPITTVALGLQHALCLNSAGEVFAWGKGERGQLGQDVLQSETHTAMPIKRAIELMPETGKPIYSEFTNIQQISAGMIHSAALDNQNQVYIWGKNILPNLQNDDGMNIKAEDTSFDARLPVKLQGLPSNLQVLQISCGSHHTAILLEDGSVWAAGVSSDTKEPMWHEAICIIPAGVIELPVRQFQAHMDRTTIVGASGRQVYQIHLWKDPEMREYALFTPAWIDNLLDDQPNARIREIHRSWIHSVVITEEEEEKEE